MRHALAQPALARAACCTNSSHRLQASAAPQGAGADRLLEDVGRAPVPTKKELLVLSREKAKLEKTLGGIREMSEGSQRRSGSWTPRRSTSPVGEARKLNIPVVAILDTNCDPDEVDYKIPGNDDAIRSVTLLTRVIADAVAEGLISRSGAAAEAEAGDKAAGEPLAAWERDLLEGEKKADEAPAADAEVQTSAETEKVADAEQADEAPAAEAAAEVEAPAAEGPLRVADAEQA
ncbi:30S ribosomal protein S2 [Streptomyces sp. L7]